VFFLKAGKLGLDPPGQKIHEQRPHLVIENDGPVVFVQDLEAEAHRAFHLPPDGDELTQVKVQKTMVHHGMRGRDVEIIQIVPALQQLGELFIKLIGVEAQAVFFRQEDDAGKVLRSLDVHVLVIAHVRKLGPEGDVHGQGQLQGRLHLVVGQYAHGGGVQVTGNQDSHSFVRIF
jgi:hypothetical protein